MALLMCPTNYVCMNDVVIGLFGIGTIDNIGNAIYSTSLQLT